MMKTYKRGDPSRVTSTVGLNIGSIDTSGISIQFWDLGGQTELQALWDKVSAVDVKLKQERRDKMYRTYLI
jgi:ADP-ribosylation factor related protein 1